MIESEFQAKTERKRGEGGGPPQARGSERGGKAAQRGGEARAGEKEAEGRVEFREFLRAEEAGRNEAPAGGEQQQQGGEEEFHALRDKGRHEGGSSRPEKPGRRRKVAT